eukprot:scaffold10136_cov162-Amphora_coffeaeformis.AAC.1
MSTSLFAKIAVGTFGAGFGGYALYETIVQTVGLRGECVVDIVGADLQVRSNNQLDRFSRPDVQVSCLHGKVKRTTQIENNCYDPRFLFRSKMPYYYNEGFAFTVLDVDRVNGNEVIGRCFVDPKTAEMVMKEKTPLLLSLGDGIGVLKVRLEKSDGSTTEKSLHEL